MKDTFMTIPTVKGSITLPIKIRKKYNIDQKTPLEISDGGGGIIKIKILKVKDYEDVMLTEDEKSLRLTFPNGVDPDVLLKKIKHIDG